SLAANEVLNKMNAIIWSLNNDNDSLDSLVYYIRAYSLEYFENTPVHCEVNVATEIPPQPVTGIKRRNTFLSVKEALNNILKHSNATKVKIDIALNKNLSLKIHDNGKGIDVNHLRKFGNGLKNMARRMESAGGTFKIENVGGTLITFELPL
ncbi:MAG: histidine kinase, partial [Bacteroidetes bacterium]|nr:histidine kinase [Bacteroidota bacterium]